MRNMEKTARPLCPNCSAPLTGWIKNGLTTCLVCHKTWEFDWHKGIGKERR